MGAKAPSYVLALILAASPVWAVQPDEVLADPVLEQRARDSLGRHPLPGLPQREHRREQCQSWPATCACWCANDWWRAIRTTRCWPIWWTVSGEYVLLNPPASGSTLILWGTPLALLLLGGAVAVGHVTRQRKVAAPAVLSEEEEARVKALLERDEGPRPERDGLSPSGRKGSGLDRARSRSAVHRGAAVSTGTC